MARTVITPPGRLNLPAWRELWAAREVMFRFAQRDIVLRYRQTAVGVAWVLIQPLVSAGIFSLIFGQVAKLPSEGVPYFIFAFVGMLGWNIFSGIAERAAPSLVANQALVSKVFFPRMLIPLSAGLSVLLDFLVALALLAFLLPGAGITIGWQILLLPVWVFLIALLGSGVGLAASAIMVRYRDVGYALPWVLNVLLYASPVAYAVSAMPEQLRWFVTGNPMTWLLAELRWSLLGLGAPTAGQIVASVLVSLLVFLGGTLVFQKMERGFADVI
ncbi:ABC transporter permease [Cellulomonas sp. P24]|uniref:ABC transporter permease n=1 Tax=Cellulomonas sp. P24 TaxID=2885206 RepID=UPI00216B40C6|nr:ABC transporter permease [Cellulomonas sp. P24]MCR6493777.1 ABC transporter permease [Cellulomonas sp. P24]